MSDRVRRWRRTARRPGEAWSYGVDQDYLAELASKPAGVPWVEAPVHPSGLDRESTLVIGEGALDEPHLRPRALALVERARRAGAGVLVMRQSTAFPDGLAPPLEGQEARGANAVHGPLGQKATALEREALKGVGKLRDIRLGHT